MRGKEELMVHWVNEVEEGEEKQNRPNYKTKKSQHNNKNPLNQTKHQNQSTTHEGEEEDRCLGRKFKRGVKDKGIGHWVNGIEREERTVMSRSRRKVECPEMGREIERKEPHQKMV